MKNIITAIGNPVFNNKLRENKECNVITDDIGSEQELIEWLQIEDDVDILFLSSHMIQNDTIDDFIQRLRKMQENMMIILFKGENIESSLQEDDKLKIYTNMDIEWGVLENLLKKTVNKNIKKLTSKVIAISGARGVGKSTFSAFLAKNIEKENLKTLLIDFDLDQNHIRTILKVKKQPFYQGEINDLIVNIRKNVDVLCHLDVAFQDNAIDFWQIQDIFKKLKEQYNLILIDTSSNLANDYIKRIFYQSDEIFFLVEPNILGVKKAKDMLEVLEEDWKVTQSKIKIILNKTSMYQITDSILEELFSDIPIVGKMKYLDSYQLLLNKNINKREIKMEYDKICKKLVI